MFFTKTIQQKDKPVKQLNRINNIIKKNFTEENLKEPSLNIFNLSTRQLR